MSEAELAALLEKSTFPPNVGVDVYGSYSEDEATKAAEATLFFLRFFGAFLNLEGMEASA